MTSNKNLRTSLVAIVIFGVVISSLEPGALSTQMSDVSLTVSTSTQPSEIDPKNVRQHLVSYIESTQTDHELLQPMLILLFLAIKIAMIISFGILVLMVVCSRTWRRVCHSKGLVVPISVRNDVVKRVPFDNKHFPESIKKTMSHSDLV